MRSWSRYRRIVGVGVAEILAQAEAVGREKSDIGIELLERRLGEAAAGGERGTTGESREAKNAAPDDRISSIGGS